MPPNDEVIPWDRGFFFLLRNQPKHYSFFKPNGIQRQSFLSRVVCNSGHKHLIIAFAPSRAKLLVRVWIFCLEVVTVCNVLEPCNVGQKLLIPVLCFAWAKNWGTLKKFFFNLLILEGEGERTSICCSTYTFIGCFLYVPWLEIEPTTLAYQKDALTNWATWPAHWGAFKVHTTQLPLPCPLFVNPRVA